MNEIVMTVSQITSYIREILESTFSEVTVEGELSNVRPSSTGHLYFSLKDSKALISCVMFRSQYQKLRVRPGDGMKVRVRGRLSLYEPRGNYQIVCSSLEDSGKGDLLQILEERKQRYLQYGYFDEELKKPLPAFPRLTAVITSPTGAALHDIMRVLKRRGALCRLLIIPVPVQGKDAGRQIAGALRRAGDLEGCDTIILARGGGALEDLLPFSDEAVIEAIHNLEIPVVTGIGHEIDHALADFTADRRCATPSAAAEVLFPRSGELVDRIDHLRDIMREQVERRLVTSRKDLQLHSPVKAVALWQHKIESLKLRTDDLAENIQRHTNQYIENRKRRLELLRVTLKESSPEAVLKKGYSLVEKSGRFIHNRMNLREGDRVTLHFHDGKIEGELHERK